MIVSFSGLDGSGKTTNALFVIDYLRKKGIECSYVHIQHRSLFAIVGEIFKKKYPKAQKRITKKEFDLKDKSFSKYLIGLLRKVTYTFDMFTFYIEILTAKMHKRVLVCDRYFYDLAVQSRYMRLFGTGFFDFYVSIVPKADIAFFLEIDDKTAFKRAKEHNIFFFKKKKELYKKLDGRFIKIKASTIEKTKNKIKRIIDNSF